MSTNALVFKDGQFSEYSPQSVCMRGEKDFDIGAELELRSQKDSLGDRKVGDGRIIGSVTSPFDQLPASWVARYHLPGLHTRYELADELERRWEGFDTKTVCTLILLEIDLVAA